jgi:hypothetical protein
VYSQSPKNQREIDEVAKNMSIELLKIQKVFDIRWVFSSFNAVRSLLTDFPALYQHFLTSGSPESVRSGKERSKYQGLAKKIQSWLFLAETSMIKDALQCLSILSLYLQSDRSSVIDSMAHIRNVKDKLLAMKDINGACLGKFVTSFDADGYYMGVEIVKANDDERKFVSLRNQFFTALYDNMEQRFPHTEFLQAASVLNKATWPSDPLQRALFGENEIAFLCNEFNIASADAAEIVMNYTLYKAGQVMGEHLAEFVNLLKVLPISSAACERGFSQMNLHNTSVRNRLAVERVNDLLMLSINGPPLTVWNATKYVIAWLKSGKHGALDKLTGLAKVKIDVNKSVKLFL